MELQEYIDNKLVHSIHTSERRSFRSCRRRHNWAYKEMFYPKVTPPALEFGVAFHKAMEHFYEPTMWGISLEAQQGLALKAFSDECAVQLKNYKKLNGEPEVSVLEDYKARVQLGLGMIRFYTAEISPQFDQGFTPVEVEVAFEVPILSPQGEPIWCKCDQCWRKYGNSRFCNPAWRDDPEVRKAWMGLPVTYGGRLDMLAKDKYGRYWIFDWKSTARMINEGTEEAFLELDDQIASYCWALRTLGIPVAGFVYVEIKKAHPQPPEELTRVYKGRKFSCNKQAMTTYDLFLRHVMQHDTEAFAQGLYEEHLIWLFREGPRFHQRFQIHKNDYEIEEIGNNVYLEALDMVGTPRVYPQPGRFSCPTCLYRQPCLGKNQGEDYIYTLDTLFEKREKHYYEEKEPSTD